MRPDTRIVSGLAALVMLAGVAGCSSPGDATASTRSHAEIWRAHRAKTASNDQIAFAIGDAQGVSMLRNSDQTGASDASFVVIRSHGFVAGDTVGAITMRSSATTNAVADADDNRD